jgi:carbonic anhydrase/acetyltransferase-like protein (isoleucine patch superfamily)
MLKSYKGIKPRIAETAFIEDSAAIIGDVEIGEHSSVWFNCVLRGDVFHIRIGHHTNIQDGTIIHVTSGEFPTLIGNHVTVGHGVILHGCQVQDGSLIGIGSIILDEAVIGEESLIAAGSLVTPGTIIPPRSLVMGSPAKVRRELTQEEVSRINENWQHYVELKDVYRIESSSEISSGIE